MCASGCIKIGMNPNGITERGNAKIGSIRLSRFYAEIT